MTSSMVLRNLAMKPVRARLSAAPFFSMTRIKTIDAEVAGEAVRLVVSGGPSVPGRTMAEKRNWLRKHGDELRRLLMLEPRGHAGMARC